MAERDDDIVEMVNIDRKFSVRRTIDDIANMASPKSAVSPSPGASASHLHTYATDPIQMRKKLDENLLEKNQFKASKEMMRNIEFNVPIDELYKVVASCNYNINNFYCPVLVKIIDETILDRMTRKAYLLQVWNKLGEMVFERSLNQPVANWNISGDIFMYQENS